MLRAIGPSECDFCACAGDHLDPQEVLQALPPGMPLAAAAAVLAPMMRDRLHRRRQVGRRMGPSLGGWLAPVRGCDGWERHTV